MDRDHTDNTKNEMTAVHKSIVSTGFQQVQKFSNMADDKRNVR
jgi:hypothetical protein